MTRTWYDLHAHRLVPGFGYREDDGTERPVTNMEMFNYIHRKERQMTKVGDMFGGTFLKASDLKGKLVTVTISDIFEGLVPDNNAPEGKCMKWLVAFEKKEKQLVLNKTNANMIALQHGDEIEAWVGKQIKLYEAQVDFKGDIVPAIRVYQELSPVQEAEEDIPF